MVCGAVMVNYESEATASESVSTVHLVCFISEKIFLTRVHRSYLGIVEQPFFLIIVEQKCLLPIKCSILNT